MGQRSVIEFEPAQQAAEQQLKEGKQGDEDVYARIFLDSLVAFGNETPVAPLAYLPERDQNPDHGEQHIEIPAHIEPIGTQQDKGKDNGECEGTECEQS